MQREESGRVLALLAARFNDVDLADDAVQDALVQAVETWATTGIPSNPAGWLYTVAHNRIIDRLRRDAVARRRLQASAPELTAVYDDDEEEVPIVETVLDEHGHVGDEQLRLMLLCCHPALDRDTQVALTLRLVAGLTTPEIAAAFLVPEATLAQRIVRAKRKIRDARIPLTIPAELDERVDSLLTVLYLVFNEGYLARGGATDAVRVSLADEAVRLTSLAIDLLPAGADRQSAEAEALLALELYHRARLDTRLDAAGDIVLLADQDRSRWDGAMIGRANGILKRVLGRQAAGPYQVQALIASQHANAVEAADTDWTVIASLYAQLMTIAPSPVVALNRVVAVSMADGPGAGLALLDEIEGLERYHLYWSTRGELLSRMGDRDGARAAFERAGSLTANTAEQRHLARRRAAV